MCRVIQSISYQKDMKQIKRKYSELIPKIKEVIFNIKNKQIDKLTRNKMLVDGKAFGCCECHIKFDLIIVYKYINEDEVILAKVGKHDNLFKRDWANRNKWLQY